MIGPDSIIEVPLRFALLAGDAIHNLRAALDYVIYQLVLADGGTPTRATMFPILAEKPPKGFAQLPAVAGITREAPLLNLESLMPYAGQPYGQKLALLHRLDIADKHHLIRPAVVMLAEARTTPGVILMPGELKLGQEYMRSVREAQMALRWEIGYWEERVTIHDLTAMAGMMDEILNVFAREFNVPEP